MPTRMERYYNQTGQMSKRSEKNQDLYREIYEVGEYSNIEGIATIEKSNEVDISKIQNMLKNREQYQKQRQFRQVVSKPELVEKEESVNLEIEKNYDIRDVLNKAKSNKKTEEKYHSLGDTGYDILKNIKEKSKQVEKPKDLRELIDTINTNSELNQMATRELSLDMFDDLKSDHDTIVEDRGTIKSILDEAKKEEEKKKVENTEMDQSFYTSSLNINREDFEQAEEQVEKSKIGITILKVFVFIVAVAITISIIFLVYSLLK